MGSRSVFVELLVSICLAACDQPVPAEGAGSAPTASDRDGQAAMIPEPTAAEAGTRAISGVDAGAGDSSADAAVANSTPAQPASDGGAPVTGGATGAGGNVGPTANDAQPSDGQPSLPQTPPSSSSSKIYVTLYADSEITAIDGASDAVVDHIPVGRGPAILLETPDHSKLYTANWADNSVSGVKLANRDVHTIKEDGQPFVIAMSPDGKFVYSGLTSNKIDVISTESDAIVRSLPMSQFPMSVIVSADGATLYVAFAGGTAAAINAQTGAVVHPAIPVGSIPGWISLTPDGSSAYTLNWGSGDVSVINTMSWQTTATIQLGLGSDPIIGAVTPDNSLLCVTNFGTANAVIVDTKTNKTLHTLMFDGRPTGVNFSPDGKQVYIADYGHPSLSSDANSLILVGTGGGLPSNPGPGRVTVFSSSTGDKLKEIAVGQWPSSVVIQSL